MLESVPRKRCLMAVSRVLAVRERMARSKRDLHGVDAIARGFIVCSKKPSHMAVINIASTVQKTHLHLFRTTSGPLGRPWDDDLARCAGTLIQLHRCR